MAERLYLLADFNVEPLGRYLEHTALPGSQIVTAPYGQIHRALASPPPSADCSALVWTRPESVIESFRAALASDPVDVGIALEQVTAYADLVRRFATSVRHVLVPTWTLPPWHRGYGALDYRPSIGIAYLLGRMNVALAEALGGTPSVFVLDAQRWINQTGPRGWSSKLWYAAKTPFSPALFEEAAADIAAALAAAAGTARRLLILDLDDVLWGGVVGETGWEGITLGGHDYAGEAYVDFQRALKALRKRGVQLAIVSKNDERAAFDAIERHSEMQLRREDFAGWRINWVDKAQNVIELLAELRLGAESAVFIDDGAIERARVRSAVPGVLVPDWPADPARFVETLAAMRCFDTIAITEEDRGRGVMYAAERAREASLGVGRLEDWLSSLDVIVTVARLSTSDLDRTAQLFNKTNQMNMATRRLSAAELRAWDAQAGHAILTFRVADRFGDSGLCGIIGLSIEGSRALLVDFLLSCRAMGRSVEETMLAVAFTYSRAAGASQLEAGFRPTARNAPCLEFLRRSGLRSEDGATFLSSTTEAYEAPRWVTLRDAGAMVPAVDRPSR